MITLNLCMVRDCQAAAAAAAAAVAHIPISQILYRIYVAYMWHACLVFFLLV